MIRTIVATVALAVLAAGGFAASIPATTAGTTSPALHVLMAEDGSTPGQQFPAYWDASARGNGIGEDYVLTAASVGPAVLYGDDEDPASIVGAN